MKEIKFIADFFVDEVFGGGELVNEEIILGLESKGYTVRKIKCKDVQAWDLEGEILIANFVQLPPKIVFILKNSKQIELEKLPRHTYSIIEHDHKYVQQRDVTMYKGYAVSPDKIINRDFYKNAKYVYCQSKLHSDIVSKNIGLSNVVNLSTSIWSDSHLDIIEGVNTKKKITKTAILNSNNPIKNTNLCIEYCESKNIKYDLIGPSQYEDLMHILGKYEKVLILPGVLETFNRFLVEARMLNCKVVTDNRNGCTSEEWFSRLKGKELIDFIRASKESFIDNFISEPKLYKRQLPLISIITSKFKGDDHIKPFLENITKQTAFDSCELIIVDPTPGPPCKTILEYKKEYSNIIYDKIEEDPGIYGCWNKAIKLSKGKYITNANLDDRRAHTHIEHHVRFLEENKNIDLAYSECYITGRDFEDYYENTAQGRVTSTMNFANENMIKCLPGCMPVWRSSCHKNLQEMFDESYSMAGDWEMWLRFVRNGSVFEKIEGVYGIYYHNPTGLSTNAKTEKEKWQEESKVFNTYKEIIGLENYQQYTDYFNRTKNMCTISDKNYLSQGIALYESLLATSKDFTLHYLCLDNTTYEKLSKIEKNIKVYHIDDLIKNDNKLLKLKNSDYSYFCFALASYFSEKLINGFESITYIDSDIYFHKNIDIVFEEIGNRDVGIFRHRQFPLDNPKPEGYFNVGVVHFKNTAKGKETLSWWTDAVMNKKYPMLATCGDQKYLDYFPEICKNIYIDENIGHGAPWQWQMYDILSNGNIIWEGNEQPLVFTHFSKFKINETGYDPSTMHHCYTPEEMYKENKNLNLIYENYYNHIKEIEG